MEPARGDWVWQSDEVIPVETLEATLLHNCSEKLGFFFCFFMWSEIQAIFSKFLYRELPALLEKKTCVAQQLATCGSFVS